MRTSFQSKLPGYLNFANTKKRGREDGDEENFAAEWRVTLHKALINNYPENAPVMKVVRDDDTLIFSKQLPVGYYPNWNAVLRQTYDTVQETLVHVQVPKYNFIFKEQLVFQFDSDGISERAFLRQFDDGRNRTLDTHQEYMQNLARADATVKQVLDALVATMSNGTTVYEFKDTKGTLRDRYEALQIIDSTHNSGYGYFEQAGFYELRPYDWKSLFTSQYKHRFCFSEAMAILLGLHDSANYNLVNGATVTKDSDGVYIVEFSSYFSRLFWTTQVLQKKYASVLQQQVYKIFPTLSLAVNPALKTVTFKTVQNIRIVLTNKKGLLLTTLSDGEQMSFADFFADTLYRDYLQSEAMRLNILNLEFLNRIQGTSDNLNTLLHPLIPVPMEERVVAFYPQAERHERKPESICLEGSTNAQGKYAFTKTNRGFINIDRGDEVCITNLGMNNEQIFNVEEKQLSLQQTVLDQLGNTIRTHLYLPSCRIVTLRELCNQLVTLTTTSSSTAEWKMRFLDRTTCVLNPTSTSSRELLMPASMGFCLGLCDVQGNPSDFANLMKTTFNTGDTIVLNQYANADGDRWLSFRVSPGAKINDFAMRKGVPVCRPLDENIWMYVSRNSFATLFVNGDFINDSYVGRERVQAMDVFEYNTYKQGQWANYSPANVQWKRVNKYSPEELVFEFTTERNRPLSNVDFILYLNFRKKNMY
ncbi:hypothetical protein OS493_028512 [Desmophyllum pertusum]|uniref:Uncharacterized protein n=1 Tax=Desmophyllum pertusum TaxID=174260 RepID=A0A9W9ZCE3_9CNID|nr:hypothetical protein OS493_028512 [Desmophyllum pertusum]